ncbi:head GIN domain-containing protein [Mucilaginibacter sp. OK098]|uniref:head GIN domain-containing protein n=1 Tax=Mucilaginibacter sp. OK098 TaxID=1855297 RepID=UPI000916E1CE|nr:head GIN domain-containing protein [Mucilaginibacter sp. OK098]SHN16819.1 Putative auto-transporter adhesin, head GIN domain [Mucilaginibacter sp. OK098]
MKRITYIIFAAVLTVATTLRASAQSEGTRQVSGFTSIGSAGPFDVHVKINGTESLKIEASPDAIKEIETNVEDGGLQIKFKHRGNHENYGKIDIYVTAKSLSGLVNAGSGSINVEGTVSGNKVSIALSGSGSISTPVKAGDFHSVLSGSGSISLSGSADVTQVIISGSGGLDGRHFKTNTASVTLTGSGNAHFGVDKTISARIVGSGNVVYSGNATITDSHTLGSGRLSKEN